MTLHTITLPEQAAGPAHPALADKLGAAMVAIAALMLCIGGFGAFEGFDVLYMTLTFGLGSIGGVLVARGSFRGLPGIRNNGVMTSGMQRRGLVGWAMGVAFTGFYCLLYWFPESLVHVVQAVNPVSMAIRGIPADRWFLYGSLYTAAVVIMGVRMIGRYRHNRYQQIRTLSVMFFQFMAAWLVPALLIGIGSKEFYFHYFWPLKYDYLFPSTLKGLLASPDSLLVFMGFWSMAMTVIATPVLTYFFGKRWYCSWVCGCGALAETLGDPWRQNSDKSTAAWKLERWLVHGVLVFIVLTTVLVWWNSASGGHVLGKASTVVADVYGFAIGAMFSGVIGVGFYPILGSRVWCRFGCPMAAVLGILQRSFSKFRITTNGAQCISCGNCSTYCEMGIDVRAYAQRGADVKRASCVGCGVCAAVCPRGVLKLENR
jgi:Pyruvate/2-oxoacid:ferredoxin oxidoreductase delta subunit